MKLSRMLGLTLVMLAASCTETSSGPGGSTQILLTDSPFPFDRVSRVDVHVVRIEATASLDTMPGAGGWVTVVSPGRTVNLLDLQGGATALLGQADLEPGSYKAIRLTINTALSSITGVDGSVIPVQWPVAGELKMYAYIEDPIAVSPAGARIVIDFDVGRSFQPFGNGLVFLPYIRAVNDAATGTIHGTIRIGDTDAASAPLANAVVTAYRGGPAQYGSLLATGRTDAQGNYALAFLRQDAYWLTIEAPYTIEGRIESCAHTDSILVMAGSDVAVNRRLPTFDASCNNPGAADPRHDSTAVTPGGAVASVRVSLNTTILHVGDSAWAVAILKDVDSVILSGRAVTWTSSDPGLLVFAGYGPYANIRPTAAGTFTLTATSEGRQGSISFVVSAGTGNGGNGTGPVATVNVQISQIFPSIAVGDSLGAFANLFNATGGTLSGRAVTWSISDTSVVGIMGSFGQSAVLRAKKAGTATVTATSEGQAGSKSLTVVNLH
jgi:hypothetical protein